jgi:dTMP kinase
LDRLEQVGNDFMRRVEQGFEEIARSEPDRIEVLDASSPPEELAQIVAREIRDLQYTRESGA